MTVKERVERKLEKSGRITPREVLRRYEETGLRPCLGWGDGEKAGCALTAILGGHAGNGSILVAEAANRLMEGRMPHLPVFAATDYRLGFARGFDDTDFELERRSPAFRQGYRDGCRARRFVFGAAA